jgi:hypothetical protein
MRTYVWGPLDTIWSVAARFLADSGFADVPDFVAAIASANNVDLPHAPGADPAGWQAIYDWGSPGLAGRLILLPAAV